MGGYEIIEHTADVGIEASDATLEGLFEQAALGLFDILGGWDPGPGYRADVVLEPADLGGLLVDWLNELLFIQDTRDVVFTGLELEKVDEGGLRAQIGTKPRTTTLEGTAVKAATYHRLKVVKGSGGWTAQIYVDV